MKISLTLFASATTVSAFVPQTSKGVGVVSRMSEGETTDAVTTPVVETPPEPAVVAPTMSQALPFMECSAVLDGSMAGDVGFDPLGFAKTSEDLMNYREGRFCCLDACFAHRYPPLNCFWFAHMSAFVFVHSRSQACPSCNVGCRGMAVVGTL